MSKQEKKIVELGTNLSKSLATIADSLVECNGLDSTLIAVAESVIESLKQNNEKHNKLAKD